MRGNDPDQAQIRPAAFTGSRRSIRLRGYDYTRPGWYFVTICTWNRECLFGEIMGGEMRLDDTGRAAADEWIKTAGIRDAIELDEWVVMPNHLHGIVVIVDDDRNVGTVHRMGTARREGMGTARRAPTAAEQFGRPVSGSLSTIVRSFKSAATKRINELRDSPGAKLWQRNYWEHVIRNELELNRIRRYIQNNPAQWEQDRLYKQRPPIPEPPPNT